MTPERMKYLALVGLVTALMIYTYGTISYHNPAYSQWELHDYRAMAQASPGLTQAVRQPFVYRILGPLIAGLFPFSIDGSFLVLSISLALMLPILFYLYLNTLRITPSIAALVTILFVMNKYLFGFPVWNYFHVNDILSLIEILILMWALTSHKWFLFAVVLLLGSLTKETPLIMVPVAFVYLIDEKCFRETWGRVFVAVLPACLTFVALRTNLHPVGGYDLPQALTAYAQKLTQPETWFRLLINSFVPFSLLPIVFIESTRIYFKSRRYALVYLVLVLASTFFGYNNERLMAPSFNVFYPLLATIIQDHVVRTTPMVFILISMACISSFHHTYARFPLPRDITVTTSLIAFALVTLSMVYYRTRMATMHHESVR